MFIWAEHDPTVQRSNTGSFWCFHTQNCLGPDGKVAEPEFCCLIEIAVATRRNEPLR
jgi:hypothetical protein